MATISRKGSRIFFRSKEETAGTADTYDNFEGLSMRANFPPANYLQESSYGKLGAGEHGRAVETQAVFTPISFSNVSRLSEFAFLMSYFLGKADSASLIDTGVYSHELEPLAVSSRTLPTFTFEYGNTVTAMNQFKYALINDFSLTLSNGGNGVIDATFNGFANGHYDNSGALTENATVNDSSFSAGNDFSSEPLINFKGTSFWTGTGGESTPLVQASIDYGDSDLASSTDISCLINSITLSGNNGLSGEDLLRAGGGGVIACVERADRTFTLELNLRNDSPDFDAYALANTMSALEIQFAGPAISDAYRYALDIILPRISAQMATQDDGSPISVTVPFDVLQNTSDEVMNVYVQSAVSAGYNATLT